MGHETVWGYIKHSKISLTSIWKTWNFHLLQKKRTKYIYFFFSFHFILHNIKAKNLQLNFQWKISNTHLDSNCRTNSPIHSLWILLIGLYFTIIFRKNLLRIFILLTLNLMMYEYWGLTISIKSQVHWMSERFSNSFCVIS